MIPVEANQSPLWALFVVLFICIGLVIYWNTGGRE